MNAISLGIIDKAIIIAFQKAEIDRDALVDHTQPDSVTDMSLWLTRKAIAQRLGRAGHIHPNDIYALNKLTVLRILYAKQIPRDAATTALKWIYSLDHHSPYLKNFMAVKE